MRTIDAVFDAIREERRRQDEKWGSENVLQNAGDAVRLAVLTEEVGEVAKAILEGDWPEMIGELIQVAAVAVAWLEKPNFEGEDSGTPPSGNRAGS